MEQAISFLLVVAIAATLLLLNLPLIFLIFFITGGAYLVIRGKKKNWTLPKDIKDTHSW